MEQPPQTEPLPEKCAYCGKPAETPAKRVIHQNRRNPNTRRLEPFWTEMTFCSEEHGGFYQMGCEG